MTAARSLQRSLAGSDSNRWTPEAQAACGLTAAGIPYCWGTTSTTSSGLARTRDRNSAYRTTVAGPTPSLHYRSRRVELRLLAPLGIVVCGDRIAACGLHFVGFARCWDKPFRPGRALSRR